MTVCGGIQAARSCHSASAAARRCEDGSADQVTFDIEIVVAGGLNGGEALEGLDVPEPGHGDFTSLKDLVLVFGLIV